MSEEKKQLKLQKLHTPLKSNYIINAGYDEKLEKTYITFKGGKVFEYPNTTLDDFEVLSKAESIGKAFHSSYKHRQEFNELKDTVLKYEEKNEKKKSDKSK